MKYINGIQKIKETVIFKIKIKIKTYTKEEKKKQLDTKMIKIKIEKISTNRQQTRSEINKPSLELTSLSRRRSLSSRSQDFHGHLSSPDAENHMRSQGGAEETPATHLFFS